MNQYLETSIEITFGGVSTGTNDQSHEGPEDQNSNEENDEENDEEEDEEEDDEEDDDEDGLGPPKSLILKFFR